MTHSLPHPSVRTEHTPMDQTPALLDFRFRVLDCTPAHATAAGHTPKPASLPRLLLLPQHSPRMWRSSRPLPSLQSSCRSTAWTKYPFTITSSLALAVRASPQTKPKQLHCSCDPRRSNSTGHSDTSLLAHAAWHRLSFQDPRGSLWHSFAFSSVSSPGDILSGGSLGLANANLTTAIASSASFLFS